MKKLFLNLEGYEVLSKNDLKKLQGGALGPEPGDYCSGAASWSAVLNSPRCSCEASGGIWECEQCITAAEARIKLLLSNDCDQYNNWPQ